MGKTGQLEKIHSLELKIASEVKRICEKHGINYFMTAGTLLGAVRHGGFIPWDEDMDFGMLREDYERFIRICETELDSRFFLQTWDTDPEYPFSYSKVRLNGTHFVEGFSEKAKMHDGLFIDIFPFDNVPDDPKERKRQAKRYFFCKRLLWMKKKMGSNMKEGSLSQKVKYYGFKGLSMFGRYETIKQYYQRIQTKYNDRSTQKVVTDGSYSYEKESIERRWVTHLEPVKFETEYFLSYQERIEYLTYFYGDYMKLPPEEKRNRHLVRKVDFGPYE